VRWANPRVRSTEALTGIIATLAPGSWVEIFGDEVAAAAVVDRLVHHAESLSLKAGSYRLRHRRPRAPPPRQPASLSCCCSNATTPRSQGGQWPRRRHLAPLAMARCTRSRRPPAKRVNVSTGLDACGVGEGEPDFAERPGTRRRTSRPSGHQGLADVLPVASALLRFGRTSSFHPAAWSVGSVTTGGRSGEGDDWCADWRRDASGHD
jgi:hypothetical protein